MDGTIILIRHGQSEWNARNVWTGKTDIGLTDTGRQEARSAAVLLKDTPLDAAYTSELKRASETLQIILDELNLPALPVTRTPTLDERDYGIYTGKNKEEIKKQLGESEFLRLRRGWDYPVPGGESLKQVYARVIPYFESEIFPRATSGKHILIVAHGNSLRALIKKLQHVSDEEIPMVELKTGEIVVYTIGQSGAVIRYERRSL